MDEGPPSSIPSEDATTPVAPRGDDPRARVGTWVGRYELRSLLGQGGMGQVYRAWDPELQRDVAVKILRRATSDEARLRTIREARALAQLSHDNVVAVFDVSTDGDEVYIAMELVEGTDLARWVREAPRSWRAIVDVFAQAGRGLAAAHAVGIVHRDFKPRNVLVGHDGRVRVLDFGIARAEDLSSGHAPAEETSVRSGSGSVGGSRGSALTEAGAVLGTPAYMAPEQHRGERTDERSDQYAFCVALFEALMGRRPFDAKSPLELESQKRRETWGQIDPRLPGWLATVVRTGLRADPRRRHASMNALIAALQAGGGRRRKTLALAGLGAALLGVAWVRPWSHEGVAATVTCEPASERLRGLWDASVRATIGEHIRELGSEAAVDLWTRTQPVFDDYAQTWAKARTRACIDATDRPVDRSASDRSASDRKLACLGQARHALELRVQTLTALDAAQARSLDRLAGSLPDLESCQDPKRLDPMPPPRLAKRVEAVREQLAQAHAAYDRGAYGETMVLGQGAVDEADLLGYAPVRVDARMVVAAVHHRFDRRDIALQAYEDAFRIASAQNLERRAARAAKKMIYPLGVQGDLEGAKRWAEEAKAWNARAFEDPTVHDADVTGVLGEAYDHAGQYDQGRALLSEAWKVMESRADATDEMRVSTAMSLGVANQELGNYEESLRLFEIAYRSDVERFGPNHPNTAAALLNMANAHSLLGQVDEALSEHRRALKIFERELGPTHRHVGTAWLNIGSILMDTGRLEEGLAATRKAADVDIAVFGPDHPRTALAYHNLGSALMQLGRVDEGIAYHQKGLAVREASFRADAIEIGVSLDYLGRAELQRERYDRAMEHFERAAEIFNRPDPSRRSLAFVLAGMATVHAHRRAWDEAEATARELLDMQEEEDVPATAHGAASRILAEILERRGELAKAVEVLEAAVAYGEARSNPCERADTHFALAKALRAAGRQAEGLEHAERSLSEHEQCRGPLDIKDEIERWLSRHSPTSR